MKGMMAKRFKVLTYNIRFGGRGREERIARVIKQAGPDLVVLQEATDTRVVQQLAELSGMPYSGAKRKHSVAFLSRLEVRDHRWHYHPRLERAVLEIELEGVRIFGAHLRATHGNLRERGRMREVRAIIDLVSPNKDEFHILTGDFNTLAPGELLNMEQLPTKYKVLAFLLGGKLNFRAIQRMVDAGYIDCYRRLHKDDGFTFPAWDPSVRLDYFFAPKQFADHIASCAVMTNIPDPAKATDHLPLMAELEIA